MRKIALPVMILGAAVAVVVAFRGAEAVRSAPEFPALDGHEPEWPPSNMRLLYRTAGMRFDVSAGISLPGRGVEPARILFNAQDTSNYNWAEFSVEGVRLGRTEADWETELARSPKGLAGGEVHDVTVKRRDAQIMAAVDGLLVLSALDESFGPGEVGAAAKSSAVRFTRFPRPQEIEQEIALSDDFMRAKDEAGPWRAVRGEWKVFSLDHPSMSANAFRYSAKGEKALTVAGYRFWDHYYMAASIKGPANGRLGLAAAVRDSGYLLFRWGAREGLHDAEATHVGDSSEGLRELVYVSGNEEEVLASSAGGFVPGQWYRLKIVIGAGEATAYIDGHRMLSARDPRIYEGRVGLWVDSQSSAGFDDVVVGQTHEFVADFDDEHSLALWQPVAGNWRTSAGVVRATADGTPAELLGGSRRWWRYQLSADVSPKGSASAGLILNHASAFDHLKLVVFSASEGDVGRPKLSLVRVANGTETEIDSAYIPAAATYRLSCYMDGGHIAGFVDGKMLTEAWDASCRSGRIGLFVARGDAAFDSVHVRPVPSSEPILSTNAIFSQEQSMRGWASVSGDWTLGRNFIMGAQPRWHRARFPGDVTLSLPIEEETASAPKFALSIAKSGEQGRKNNGYVLKVDVDRGSGAYSEDQPEGTKGKLDMVLIREGEEVARDSFPAPTPLRSIDIRRAGSYLASYVNGSQKQAYRDARPLTESKVAWFAAGARVPDAGVDVSSAAVTDYTFGRAPVDWRVATGIWTIANKWECDPRWSFFSGRSETARRGPKAGEKLACIWNKRLYPGDVTVEFFAGIMMDRSRGGRYEYARDVNVTICGDGQDPASGYTCMFGGFDDSRSLIARQGRIVRVGGQVIPRHGSIHRQWFSVRVDRQGERIRFTVNDRMVDLIYDDPKPLEGKQIAIWTYDCGIMISRVRISGPGGVFYEEPGTIGPKTPKTIYDVSKAEKGSG